MQFLKPDEIDVVILCGGVGARLGVEMEGRPKPMVDINGKPFLDILIEYVSSFGFNRFILCTGYKSKFIEDYYRKKKTTVQFMISEEKKPLGTGGAIKNAEPLIQSDRFIALNGDSFCQVSLVKLQEFHQKKNSLLSLVLSEVNETEDFGSVRLSKTNEILEFEEKISSRKSVLVNAGIYFFETNLLSKIQSGGKVSLEHDFFPSLVGKGIYGYVVKEKLFDIGTPERLSIARNFFA